MIFKTATNLAFAAACLTAIAMMPANAQMSGPQQGGMSPNAAVPNSAPQPNQSNIPSSPAGAGDSAAMPTAQAGNHGDVSSSRSARQNVMQSQTYDRALQTNRGFRQARMRKECGPITDAQLRQSCLASFNQDEPSKGASTSHRHRHS
jgi:hypothetical protein